MGAPIAAIIFLSAKVVTDFVFRRDRLPGEQPNHAAPEWLSTEAIGVEDAEIPSTSISSSIRRWCSAPGAARTGSIAMATA